MRLEAYVSLKDRYFIEWGSILTTEAYVCLKKRYETLWS